MPFTLFSNTGVQLVHTGITLGGKPAEHGLTDLWTQIPRKDSGNPLTFAWECVFREELLIIVDTTTGPIEEGFYALDGSLKINHPRHPSLDIRIEHDELGGRGDPVKIALVLDFGNSRSMAVLVESNKIKAKPKIYPLNFTPRKPNPIFEMACPKPLDRQVFDSNFEFVYEPGVYPRPEVAVVRTTTEMRTEVEKRWFLKDTKIVRPQSIQKVENKKGHLFRSISPVRMGYEALSAQARVPLGQGIKTGMSSPKRYLWSDDKISQGIWEQINIGVAAEFQITKVNGEFFKYLRSDDADRPVGGPGDAPSKTPINPQYPARTGMTLCMYEILERAWQFMNSLEHRSKTPRPNVRRLFEDIVLTYPSGMSQVELDRYKIQVEKAVEIFYDFHLSSTNAKKPLVKMSVDEGTAGQLAFVHGEIVSFDSSELWTKVTGRPSPDGVGHVTRIACLDIGGGTTDLMIADYHSDPEVQNNFLRCETIYRDGLSKAGDELVSGLIRQILIPTIQEFLNVSGEKLSVLFAKNDDAKLNAEKQRWMKEIFVPLSRTYLKHAEDGDDQNGFTLKESIINTTILPGFQSRLEEYAGVTGLPSVEEVFFRYEPGKFYEVVEKALGLVLAEFGKVISSKQCDIVVLTGRPSRLKAIQDYLKQSIPLPASRFIPLDKFDTGNWYPFQESQKPGSISDPKSPVVVGAALEYLGRVADLEGPKVDLGREALRSQSYYWGVPSDETRAMRNSRAIFQPDPQARAESKTFTFNALSVFLGRRLSSRETAELSPVYIIQGHWDERGSPIRVTLRRDRSADDFDEILTLVKAEGTVRVKDAQGRLQDVKLENRPDLIEMKLRTMYAEEYFLDNPVISNIEFNKPNSPP